MSRLCSFYDILLFVSTLWPCHSLPGPINSSPIHKKTKPMARNPSPLANLSHEQNTFFSTLEFIYLPHILHFELVYHYEFEFYYKLTYIHPLRIYVSINILPLILGNRFPNFHPRYMHMQVCTYIRAYIYLHAWILLLEQENFMENDFGSKRL